MVRGGQVGITGEQVTRAHQVDLDESLAAADNLADLEDTGHVADKVWQVGGNQVFVHVVILVIQRADTLFFYFTETDLQ